VNKALKELEQQKLVARAYSKITLPDPQRLQDWVLSQSDSPTAF